MNYYKWEGKRQDLSITLICIGDSIESAKKTIKKELIDNGVAKSWEEFEVMGAEEKDIKEFKRLEKKFGE